MRPHDPLVPSGPLLNVLPERSDARCCTGCDRGVYARRAFVADLAARLGTTPRQAQRWVARIAGDEPVPVWLADEVCALLRLPFGYVYPDFADVVAS